MRFIIPIILFIFISGCGTDSGSDSSKISLEGSFSKPSLPEQEIFEIKTLDENLYAGTDNDLYFKSKSESAWQPMGLPNGKVRTFVVLSEQELLASVYFNSDSSTIARTTDGGKSWNPFRNGFGGSQQVIPYIMDANPKNPSVIFARSAPITNVARSINGGADWKSVVGTWDNPNLGTSTVVKIDSNNPQNIWAGGANAYFHPSLFKSENGGDNWEGLVVIKDIEATIYDILISLNSSDQVIVALGGGIHKSTDSGKTWSTVSVEGAGVFTLTHSARNTKIVYATGLNAQGTLFFAASGDFGDTWETVEFEGGPTQIQVNDMISVLQNDKEVLYFGTNKGVYSYTFTE
ncbi:MAG: hypothetical protein WC967_09505 [Balneolaceae bacterium]